MTRYAAGTPAQAGADANEPLNMLWNPSASISLRVRKIEVTGGTASVLRVYRTSTAGTQGSTVTPDLDSSFRRDAAPPSGASIRRGNFTANPTASAVPMFVAQVTGQNGSTIGWWFERPIIVRPGRGLAVYIDTLTTAMSTMFEWDE